MAARTRSQAKRDPRRSGDDAVGGTVSKAAAKPAARKKTAAKPAARKKAAAKKVPTKKVAGKSAPAAKGRAKAGERGTGKGAGEHEMLAEQNAALREELEHAKARIAQLEALHEDVTNRIDWVIDSLQTVLEDKRQA
ncbi:MAG: hypothetical protein PVI61_13595 [Methyloceanibacter sp.]|jgi:hypothetical protein